MVGVARASLTDTRSIFFHREDYNHYTLCTLPIRALSRGVTLDHNESHKKNYQKNIEDQLNNITLSQREFFFGYVYTTSSQNACLLTQS